MSKVIFATFYCKLLNLYKYIFDRVGGSWDRGLTPIKCTCNLPIKKYIYLKDVAISSLYYEQPSTLNFFNATMGFWLLFVVLLNEWHNFN